METIVQYEPELNSPHGAEQLLLSVIILNYNYGRYLRQCIDSVLAQDYESVELIVVDDGSTDDSRTVIESFGARVTASFKQNGGMVSAMNHGFRLAHGDVIMFVDSDDYLLPGAISAHASALAQAGVVRSQAFMTVLDESQPSRRSTIPGAHAAEGELRELVLQRGPGAYVSSPNSGNAWSRQFLEQVFPLPDHLRAVGGETFLMDAAPLFGRVVTLKHQPWAIYRVHDDNMNGKLEEMTATEHSHRNYPVRGTDGMARKRHIVAGCEAAGGRVAGRQLADPHFELSEPAHLGRGRGADSLRQFKVRYQGPVQPGEAVHSGAEHFLHSPGAHNPVALYCQPCHTAALHVRPFHCHQQNSICDHRTACSLIPHPRGRCVNRELSGAN